MQFYLGTPIPGWLADPAFEGVPLFVSRRRLLGHAAPLRAATRWALDSGAFTEIARFGRWTVSARQYADEARRWMTDVGRMDWCAICDWMCEEDMLKKTGKTVAEHQRLTTRSYLDLMAIDPQLPWLPTLQGWEIGDYLRHADAYLRHGLDLTRAPVVGVGSVCKRQDTGVAERLMLELYRRGIKAHGYGFKTTGVVNAGRWMASADSMAWSYAARFRPVRLPGCKHECCENCPTWALRWRRQLWMKLGCTV